MFTDSPATPARVEAVVDVVRWFDGTVDTETLAGVVQPRCLPGVKTSSNQGRESIQAASELGLIKANRSVTEATFDVRVPTSSRALVLSSFDRIVLAGTQVERHFALFYAFLLGFGSALESLGREELVARFETVVYRGKRGENPFNSSKLSGQLRWMRYAGLGWHDSKDNFQPNPYKRVWRQLRTIFKGTPDLPAQGFMAALANQCPEVDGGTLFLQANPDYKIDQMACTAGLSHALIDLHHDGIIRLHGYPDSAGWSLKAAEPTSDTKTFQSDRFDRVELIQLNSEESIA